QVSIHGFEVLVYVGRQVVGLLTCATESAQRLKDGTRELVHAYENEYSLGLQDWPDNAHQFGTDWRIVSPEGNDSERIKSVIFSNPEGLTRGEIANRLNMPVKRVGTTIKKVLDFDPDFVEIKSGRKRLVRFQSTLIDEKTVSDTRR
ncbi:MAG: hypothetical protein ACFE7R_02210, partial [Candidatus Hodarchaeota archaeon]